MLLRQRNLLDGKKVKVKQLHELEAQIIKLYLSKSSHHHPGLFQT